MNDRERGIFGIEEPLTRQEQLRKIEEFDRGRKERMKSMREHTPRNIALSKILEANTLEKIEQARRTIREWIEEHPEDKTEFGRYASDLVRMEISVRVKEKKRLAELDADVAGTSGTSETSGTGSMEESGSEPSSGSSSGSSGAS